MTRKRRPAFFDGYCVDNATKRRLRRDEIRECWRLWSKHRDIRTNPERWGALPMGEPRP
jgi:hypothetical protein